MLEHLFSPVFFINKVTILTPALASKVLEDREESGSFFSEPHEFLHGEAVFVKAFCSFEFSGEYADVSS